jgi:LytS/YehU family sensor histidine kinase
VEIVARRRGPHLEVTVSDDGIGFGPTAGGSGVGLVNIRRQLATRYGDRARLLLEQGGSGVRAQISVPWTSEDLAAPGRRVPTVASPAANAP